MSFVLNNLKWPAIGHRQVCERKLFTGLTMGITLKWSGPARKKLIIVHDTEENLLASALNRLNSKHNTEPNSTVAKKSTKNEKSNEGDEVVIDPQAEKSYFISSVIENTSVNVKDLQ